MAHAISVESKAMAYRGPKPFWDPWYKTTRWKHVARAQLRREPFCRDCTDRNVLGVVAEIVDHVTPHHGDALAFWYGKLQSLCTHCHESRKKYVEHRGFNNDIGIDGMPIDRRHPFYTGVVPAIGGERRKILDKISNRFQSRQQKNNTTGGA